MQLVDITKKTGVFLFLFQKVVNMSQEAFIVNIT